MMKKKLLDFIKNSPTAYHAVASAAAELDAAGYTLLPENGRWELAAGKGYYVTRNGSSLLAFRVPKGMPSGFTMAAAHGDSPCPKIKDNASLASKGYIRISTEGYGGMLMGPWFDRPLSVAGRLTVRCGSGLKVKLVDLKKPVCIIPSLCPHLQDHANSNVTYNPAVDMIPLLSSDAEKLDIRTMAAAEAGVSPEDILSADLFVYNPQEGVEWNGFVSSPRLDDLQSAYALLKGFLSAKKSGAIPVYCLFDNEEVGSGTRQGAAGTFLFDTLDRIACCLGMESQNKDALFANSFMVSCDNAHAVHPNHPEVSDANHGVYMNGGIVLKHNANQKYTTDAISAGVFRLICAEADVPCQDYTNRADQRGGSTLGNISTSQVSVSTVDIGLAQLAMHSCYETAGALDTDYLVKAMTVYFSKELTADSDGMQIK